MLVIRSKELERILVEVNGEPVVVTLAEGYKGGALIGVTAGRQHRVIREEHWTERERLLAAVAQAAQRKRQDAARTPSERRCDGCEGGWAVHSVVEGDAVRRLCTECNDRRADAARAGQCREEF